MGCASKSTSMKGTHMFWFWFMLVVTIAYLAFIGYTFFTAEGRTVGRPDNWVKFNPVEFKRLSFKK